VCAVAGGASTASQYISSMLGLLHHSIYCCGVLTAITVGSCAVKHASVIARAAVLHGFATSLLSCSVLTRYTFCKINYYSPILQCGTYQVLLAQTWLLTLAMHSAAPT